MNRCSLKVWKCFNLIKYYEWVKLIYFVILSNSQTYFNVYLYLIKRLKYNTKHVFREIWANQTVDNDRGQSYLLYVTQKEEEFVFFYI